jgi:hypothetical protein
MRYVIAIKDCNGTKTHDMYRKPEAAKGKASIKCWLFDAQRWTVSRLTPACGSGSREGCSAKNTEYVGTTVSRDGRVLQPATDNNYGVRSREGCSRRCCTFHCFKIHRRTSYRTYNSVRRRVQGRAFCRCSRMLLSVLSNEGRFAN